MLFVYFFIYNLPTFQELCFNLQLITLIEKRKPFSKHNYCSENGFIC